MCGWTFQTPYQSLHQRTGNQACSHSSLHQPHYTPLTCASANCSQTTQWLTFSVAPCCFTCLETYLRPTAPGLKTAKGQQHKEKTRPGIATEQRLWQRRTLMPRTTTVTQPHNHSCGQHALTPEWLTNLTSRRGHTHTHTHGCWPNSHDLRLTYTFVYSLCFCVRTAVTRPVDASLPSPGVITSHFLS